MVLEVQIEENLEKNGSKNVIFFAYVFESILERFGAGLGRVLGGVWELLGVSWGTFKLLFLRLCCQEGPRGSKRRPRGLLGSIWEGFGRVLGRAWEVKIIKKSRFWYFLDMLFDALILVVFCSIFDNFDGGMVKIA